MFGDLVERIADRLNPILIKEVRQALRARYFKVSYGLTLSVATLVAIFVLIAPVDDNSDQLGRPFFFATYACLAAALFFWVPFFSFLSMGAEWEENTYDLLVLSDLRPRRIVYGKLWSSGVQAMVYYSAFAPFLVFAFLLHGVDLFSMLLILGASLVYSLALSLFAIGLSSLSSVRLARRALMSFAAVSLVFFSGWGIAYSFLIFEFPGGGFRDVVMATATIVTLCLAAGVMLAEVACVRLAHPEENRSTGPRVTLLIGILVALGYLWWWSGVSTYSEELMITSFIGVVALTFFSMFFMTEPDALGRRVTLHVPRKRWQALLSIPFLPGGGRGVLFHLLCLAVLTGGPLLLLFYRGGHIGQVRDEGLYSVALAAAYLFVFLALPSLILRRWSQWLVWRSLARALVLFLWLGSFLLPTLAMFFLGDRTELYKHPGNMFWVVSEAWDGWGGRDEMLLGLGVLAVIMGALHLPRILASVREVLDASEARRVRERVATERAEDAASGS